MYDAERAIYQYDPDCKHAVTNQDYTYSFFTTSPDIVDLSYLWLIIMKIWSKERDRPYTSSISDFSIVESNGQRPEQGKILAKPYLRIRLGRTPDMVQLITQVDPCPLFQVRNNKV